jgi:hypothetical protein
MSNNQKLELKKYLSATGGAVLVVALFVSS